jgi:hypothetical protein
MIFLFSGKLALYYSVLLWTYAPFISSANSALNYLHLLMCSLANCPFLLFVFSLYILHIWLFTIWLVHSSSKLPLSFACSWFMEYFTVGVGSYLVWITSQFTIETKAFRFFASYLLHHKFHITLCFRFQIKLFSYYIMFPLICCHFKLCRGSTFMSVMLWPQEQGSTA